MTEPNGEVEAAMERLRTAERQRRSAIDDLIRLGAVRSHVLVGDLGEMLAARYYGVELERAFMPGYDLTDQQGRRVQVKTLRSTPERPRTIIGEVRDPCDVVLAIRLTFDYMPMEAIEMPAPVAKEHVGKNNKVSWTKRLVEDPRVRHLTAEELLGGP